MITKNNQRNTIEKILNTKQKKRFFKILKKLFPNLPIDTIVIAKVQDNEMYPSIKKLGYVVIDTSKKDITENLYALDFNGYIIIKRLQFDMDGNVNVFTDNKISLNSYCYKLTKKQLSSVIIGRVIHIIH